MTKLTRLVLSATAASLVSLALATPSVEAGVCRPAYFIAFDEQDCADTCHSNDCNYQYDPETSTCTCSIPW